MVDEKVFFKEYGKIKETTIKVIVFEYSTSNNKIEKLNIQTVRVIKEKDDIKVISIDLQKNDVLYLNNRKIGEMEIIKKEVNLSTYNIEIQSQIILPYNFIINKNQNYIYYKLNMLFKNNIVEIFNKLQKKVNKNIWDTSLEKYEESYIIYTETENIQVRRAIGLTFNRQNESNLSTKKDDKVTYVKYIYQKIAVDKTPLELEKEKEKTIPNWSNLTSHNNESMEEENNKLIRYKIIKIYDNNDVFKSLENKELHKDEFDESIKIPKENKILETVILSKSMIESNTKKELNDKLINNFFERASFMQRRSREDQIEVLNFSHIN